MAGRHADAKVSTNRISKCITNIVASEGTTFGTNFDVYASVATSYLQTRTGARSRTTRRTSASRAPTPKNDVGRSSPRAGVVRSEGVASSQGQDTEMSMSLGCAAGPNIIDSSRSKRPSNLISTYMLPRVHVVGRDHHLQPVSASRPHVRRQLVVTDRIGRDLGVEFEEDAVLVPRAGPTSPEYGRGRSGVPTLRRSMGEWCECAPVAVTQAPAATSDASPGPASGAAARVLRRRE